LVLDQLDPKFEISQFAIRNSQIRNSALSGALGKSGSSRLIFNQEMRGFKSHTPSQPYVGRSSMAEHRTVTAPGEGSTPFDPPKKILICSCAVCVISWIVCSVRHRNDPRSNTKRHEKKITRESKPQNPKSKSIRDCSLAGIKRCTVDAEIASSSLVSPATSFHSHAPVRGCQFR
jgi:hypothetical protein